MLSQIRMESGGTATLRVPKKRTLVQRVMRRGVDYHTRPVSLDRAAEILRIETARGGV